MDITWERIKRMKLRNKLAVIYTVVFTALLAISFISVYAFSEQFRKEEFYKRLTDRTVTTFKTSIQVDQIDNRQLKLVDENTINSLSNEQFRIYDSSGKLIYSTADSADAPRFRLILSELDGANSEYQGSDGKYQLLGFRFKDRGRTYYAIAKAYDIFGERKMHYLSVLLIFTFLVVTVLVIVLSFILSDIITKPVSKLAQNIEIISPDNLSRRVLTDSTNDEIGFLAGKFNELLDRLESAFKFQVHYIHHLSHELKTPLAIMMTNAERSLAENENDKLRTSLQFQQNAIMELSNIINALLDISKTEQKLIDIHSDTIRIDEIVFECMEEIRFLNNTIAFDLDIRHVADENDLTVKGNSRMIKMVIMNLMKNAVNYSLHMRPAIHISSTNGKIDISFRNDGALIDADDQEKLFRHSFRGKNSDSVKGFGMGLVLSQRIVGMHKGSLEYSVFETNKNSFTLSLPTV